MPLCLIDLPIAQLGLDPGSLRRKTGRKRISIAAPVEGLIAANAKPPEK